MSNKLNYLEKPLTNEQMLEKSDENNYIEGVVAISESEMFYNDFENFLDLISEKLCDSPYFNYRRLVKKQLKTSI